MVPRGGAHELAAEHTDHVGGIDAIAGLWLDGVDIAAVGDLAGLQAEIDREGLDDGAGDGEGAGVGADEDAEEAEEFAEDDGEEGHEAVDDEAGVQGPEAHGADADEGEEADGEGGVVVGRGGEEEGQGCPEGVEGAGGEEAGQTRLHQDRVPRHHARDAPQHFEVVEPARVRRRVVGHEQPQQHQDHVLQPERQPVDVAPRRVFRHHARQHPRDQQAQDEARHDDGEGGRPPRRRRQVADQREHQLRRDGRDGRDERERGEDGEGVGEAEPDPESKPHACQHQNPSTATPILLESLESCHPYQTVAVKHTNINTNALRRNISPSGHKNSSPAAYPACISVGTVETRSFVTPKLSASLFRIGWL